MSIPIKWKGEWLLSDITDRSTEEIKAFEWLAFKDEDNGKIGIRITDMHICRLYETQKGWRVFIDFIDTTDIYEGPYSLEEAKRFALRRVRKDLVEDIDSRKSEVEEDPESYPGKKAEEFINYPLQQIAMIDEALARDDLQSPKEKITYRN